MPYWFNFENLGYTRGSNGNKQPYATYLYIVIFLSHFISF